MSQGQTTKRERQRETETETERHGETERDGETEMERDREKRQRWLCEDILWVHVYEFVICWLLSHGVTNIIVWVTL